MDGEEIVFSDIIPNDITETCTAIPAPFNAHVHAADSFISEEPPLDLADAVGPGGLKHKQLESASEATIVNSLHRSISIIEESGATGYADFREGGIKGVLQEKNISTHVEKRILGRPNTISDIPGVLKNADGISLSSIVDSQTELAHSASEQCISKGKKFAFHLSEKMREDSQLAISLRPSFLIHCCRCTQDELKSIASSGIPVAITPRSNAFFGIDLDYSTYLKAGVQILLGTDNAMFSDPDIFQEMAFLYSHSRSRTRIAPETIISIAAENWRGLFPDVAAKREYLLFRSTEMSPYEVVMHATYRQKDAVVLTQDGNIT